MQRVLKKGVVLGLALLVAPALAGGSKIGVVDFQKIGMEAPMAKRMQAQLKKQFSARQEKLKAQQKALLASDKKLNRDRSIMSEKEQKALESKVLESRRHLQRAAQDFQEDVARVEHDNMEKFSKKVKKVLSDVASKKGLDMVLNVQAVPYATPALDITDAVLQRLS